MTEVVTIPIEKVLSGAIFASMSTDEREALLSRYIGVLLETPTDHYGRAQSGGKTAIVRMIEGEVERAAREIVAKEVKAHHDEIEAAVRSALTDGTAALVQAFFDAAVQKLSKGY